MGWGYAVPGISDTVVSGVAYRSVNLGLNGFLRDDSLGHVFWLDGVGGQEVMLYDFTASAGDTIIYPPGIVFRDTLLVEQVDTIMVTGTLRRVLTVSLGLAGGGGYYARWIQGIGSTGGLFNLCQGPSVSGTSWLTCMSENGIAQYGGNTGEPYDCLVHLSVDELTDDRQHHGIHPNPSTGVFQLTGTAPILEVQVLDTQGREVLRTRDRTFDLTGHSPGIYMMVVITGSSRQVIRSLLVTP